MSGTSWYRTTFNLHIPTVDDASLGLTIGTPSTPQSSANYRALIFVNGWNMGQYIADVGPQHTFVIPNGVLNPDGRNTLAIAVTSDGGPATGWRRSRSPNLGTVRGGVPVQDGSRPRTGTRRPGVRRPSPSEVAMEGVTGNAATPARGGDTFTVTGTVANLSGPAATDVSGALDLPAGWTASPVHAGDDRHACARRLTAAELDGHDPRRRRAGQLLGRGGSQLPAGVAPAVRPARPTG